MTGSTITRLNCKSEINLTESLAATLMAAMRKLFARQSKVQRNALIEQLKKVGSR